MHKNNDKTLKKFIVGLSVIIIVVMLFCTKFNPIRLLGSLYNADQINENIDKIKIGDTITYEINGYSNWQVVSIDKGNNTIDVVSRDNVEDVTLTFKDDYDNFLDILQTTANKYVDGKLAIKARSVSRADLDNFAFEGEFWNVDIYDGAVAYTTGAIKYEEFENDPHSYYYIPYVTINGVIDAYSYSQGSQYNIDIDGITEWYIIDIPYDSKLTLIPKTPIELSFETNEQFRENPTAFIANYYAEIKNSNDRVEEVGNIPDRFGFWVLRDYEDIRNNFMTESKILKVYNGYFDVNNRYTYREVGGNISVIDFENQSDSCCEWESYKTEISLLKGLDQ